MNKWSFKISQAFKNWEMVCEERFQCLKANEEELNRIFIDIYGLQDELTPEALEKKLAEAKDEETGGGAPEQN